MNTLSLLIYFAGVTGSIGSFLVLITFLTAVAAALCIVGWLIYHDETNSSFRPYTGDKLFEIRKTREDWGKRVIIFASLATFIGIISSLIPNRQTVLLIAASEMGEKVLNHPKVEQVVDPSIELITTWMKNETAEIKKRMEVKQ